MAIGALAVVDSVVWLAERGPGRHGWVGRVSTAPQGTGQPRVKKEPSPAEREEGLRERMDELGVCVGWGVVAIMYPVWESYIMTPG
jgi:hypothetical protein